MSQPLEHSTPGRAGDSAVSFASIGIAPDLVATLAKAGIASPFPVQAATIPDVLAGRDVSGKARTGSGKTLAFGLPLIMRTRRAEPRRPRAVVLVPTRELASQVVDNLSPLAATRGLRIAAIVGGVSLPGQRQRLRGGVDIVVATPGRLNDLLEREDASMADVEIAVLDEADQMADLGFLPQVRRILDRIGRSHQTLLFSATLDGEVDALVRRYQHEPVRHEVPTPEEEETAMLHRFVGVEEAHRVAVTARIAAGPERTLLFVRTQRGADRLARQLDGAGVRAGVIHGGLSQPRRERALADFARGRVPVLVATNIAARGIHVDGVDTVVHHDPPEDAKTYLHRSGRTARAGASGLVVTLVGPEQRRDVDLLRRQAGVREAIVPMTPDDGRLDALADWAPPLEERREQRPAMSRPAGGGGAPRTGHVRRGRRPEPRQHEPAGNASGANPGRAGSNNHAGTTFGGPAVRVGAGEGARRRWRP